jgi:hypothetical protein
MLPSAARSAILGFLAVGQVSARKEDITVSDINIHRVKSSAGESIPKISFTLSGAKANNQGCSAENIAWPEPEQSYPCGSTSYSFLLLPGEDGKDYGLMIYHDVGDRLVFPNVKKGSPLTRDYRKADLRGWIDVDADCKKSEKGQSGEETCTMKGPINKTIDGPVGDSPGGLFGSLFGGLFGDL